MTNFWRPVYSLIICLLAALCDTLIRITENHWFLRLISNFSESFSEYESAFRICVGIIIHAKLQLNLFQPLQSSDGEISILFHRCFIILRVQRLQYIKNAVLSEMVPFLKSKLLVFFSSQWNLPYQITVFANCVVKTWTSRWALHCF